MENQASRTPQYQQSISRLSAAGAVQIDAG
jgi:hypothetical protein